MLTHLDLLWSEVIEAGGSFARDESAVCSGQNRTRLFVTENGIV